MTASVNGKSEISLARRDRRQSPANRCRAGGGKYMKIRCYGKKFNQSIKYDIVLSAEKELYSEEVENS